MKVYEKELEIRSSRRVEFIDITSKILQVVKDSNISEGLCVIFVPHTTAGVTINENADPDVVFDIVKKLDSLIPRNDNYTHSEGNSDAHIKSSLIGVSLNLVITDGKIKLGTWQGIYFCEFDGPRYRKLWIKIIGE